MKKFFNIQGIIDHLKKTLFYEKKDLQNEFTRMNKILSNFQPNMIKTINTSNEISELDKSINDERITANKETATNNLKLELNLEDLNL